MRKIRNIIVFLLAALMVSFLAAGCSDKKTEDIMTESGAEDPSPTDSAEKKKVTLYTTSMWGGTDANADNYQDTIKRFMEQYPHVTVEDNSQSSTQEWKTTIAADFAVGNEPDVILYFTDANASEVLKTDKFMTIAEIREEFPDYAKDILLDALELAANSDGIQRAVPTNGYWEGLFCNKDIFDQYGVEIPTDWDSLVNAIQIFRANNVTPIAVALNHVPHYWIEFLLLYAAGPDGYTTVPAAADADWARGLLMFKELREMGAFPDDTDTIDNEHIGEMFINKQAAMQLDGSWFANQVIDQDQTVVIPFPGIPDQKADPGSMVGGISSGFYITRKAWEDPEKREAAVAFVEAHTSVEQITTYWGGVGAAAVTVEEFPELTPLGRSGAEYSNSATSIQAPTDSRISQEAYNTLVSGIVDISTGARTPEELIQEVININER